MLKIRFHLYMFCGVELWSLGLWGCISLWTANGKLTVNHYITILEFFVVLHLKHKMKDRCVKREKEEPRMKDRGVKEEPRMKDGGLKEEPRMKDRCEEGEGRARWLAGIVQGRQNQQLTGTASVRTFRWSLKQSGACRDMS